jgi:hypothetical protein
LQRVFDAQTLTEATVILTILAERGIHPQPLRTLPRFSQAGIQMLYGIEVPINQATAATAVLERYGVLRKTA